MALIIDIGLDSYWHGAEFTQELIDSINDVGPGEDQLN